MATTVELIKEKLNIVDIIGSAIKIEKAGINFKARCPFHNEKTPSMMISPSRNSFYCFGCGAKGDIFDFVQRFEGLDFAGALRLLADKAGVAVVYDKQEVKGEKEKLLEVLEAATSFFENNLKTNPDAKNYLLSRGLKEETIQSFRLGYALPQWRALSAHLIELGFSEDLIEKAGLSKQGGHGHYDRFRGRIMFPIADQHGRIVAYSGRIFDKSLEPAGSEPAKYVNSPETLLFHKSNVLYGFDKAKEGIRKWTFVIVVEGQMDLLMSHQSGYNNTVAISGTALTEEQLQLIKRFTERIVLSLDADAAGISASGKSASLALSHGFDVKMAHLHGGKDPADIIKDDEAQWRDAIKNAKHIIVFYLDVLQEKITDKRAFKLSVAKTVLPYLRLMSNAVDRAHFMSLVAERLSIPVSAIEEELSKVTQEAQTSSMQTNITKSPLRTDVTELLTRKDIIVRYILGMLLADKEMTAAEKDAVIEKLSEVVGKEEIVRLQNEGSASEVAFQIESMKAGSAVTTSIADLLLNLSFEVLQSKRNQLQEQIRAGEHEGLDELPALMREYQAVSKEASELEKKLKQMGSMVT